MPNVGPMELIVVLVIALVILGPKKLPEMGRSVGTGMREFKDSLSRGSLEKEQGGHLRPVSAAGGDGRGLIEPRSHHASSSHSQP